MSRRTLWIAGVLVLAGCGGLAADGGTPPPARVAGCTAEGCTERLGPDGSIARRGEAGSGGVGGAADGAGLFEPDGDDPMARDHEPVSRGGVGEPCRTGSARGERVRIGEIVLEASGSCDVGHLCLSWASSVDPACSGATGATACPGGSGDELVPVPPQLAPVRPAMDQICTCRCDRRAADGDACVCPEGMECRELIASSGVNGAASELVGAYCLY